VILVEKAGRTDGPGCGADERSETVNGNGYAALFGMPAIAKYSTPELG